MGCRVRLVNMGVYDRQIAVATRLIKAKGEVCTWRKAGAPTIADASKPWIKEDAAPTDSTVSIVWLSDNSSPFQMLTSSEVESGGQKGLMASVPFTPDLKDMIITSSGKALQLEKLFPIAPNGKALLWGMLTK